MSVPLGLCASCAHARPIEAARSTFLFCQLSLGDAAFPRYPRLPVMACRGFSAV